MHYYIYEKWRNNMINEDEIEKYKKRKKSNISKSDRKSKHKHEYKDCLLIEKDKKPHKAKYCKICGKIDDVKFFETTKLNEHFYRQLTYEEVFEKYKDLEKFYVDSVWDKYVGISKGE